MSTVGRPLDFQHQRIQRLRRLIGRRSSREDEHVCVIEGAKVLNEALDAGCRVESMFMVEGWTDPVVERTLALGIPVFELAPGVLEKIADTVTPQPLLAIASSPVLGVDDLEKLVGPPMGPDLLVIVGVDLRDPGNVGTLIRSAEASGASALVLCDGCVEATSPKTLRSSAGAVFHLPIVQGGQPEHVLRVLGAAGIRRLATAVHGEAIDYRSEGTLSGRVAVVLGNEANGLEGSMVDGFDGWITIPMTGRTESLNVGVTGSILAFEAARQRSL